ncbi:hypothetical protein FPZ24_04945 [Sphingomonas panacisoli]|uniref:Tail specific protease domain-containing protein n=1 Tax=Sphingomonas panacisoli TaxID=1813879 RepID=A0A5B8LFC8_9SPHN|nr:hypothetical protein [Sphingomonas panacisoli]QDZ06907.1 hypothetical protein FPZ24_04945 [Sphingomonas panacisoli]
MATTGGRLSAVTESLKIAATVRGRRLVGKLVEGSNILSFALDRIPNYPKPGDRLEAWAQDLEALATRLPKADHSFTPATRLAFTEAVAAIKHDLPLLSDQQVMARMASAMALARNAHTRLYLVRVRTQVRMLPIKVWWFSDGLRIVRTAPAYASLLGCRVTDIEGVDVRHARDIVAPAYAGNAGWVDYMSTYTLGSAELLSGYGITASPDRAVFGLADCAAPPRATLPAMPPAKTNSAVEAWWDLAPGMAVAGWPQVLGTATPPLYLRHPDKNYWQEYLSDSATLYVQYNRAAEIPDQSVAAFTKSVMAMFDAHPVKRFVLDLRLNTGGNQDIAKGLMETLAKRTQGMARFVITSRATFSAGISHAAYWRQFPDVKIVGELVGDSMDFWSEGGNLLLPNSGLAAHFANVPHSFSTAPCPPVNYCEEGSAPSLRPDVPTFLSWQQYIEKRDPSLEAIVGR